MVGNKALPISKEAAVLVVREESLEKLEAEDPSALAEP